MWSLLLSYLNYCNKSSEWIRWILLVFLRLVLLSLSSVAFLILSLIADVNFKHKYFNWLCFCTLQFHKSENCFPVQVFWRSFAWVLRYGSAYNNYSTDDRSWRVYDMILRRQIDPFLVRKAVGKIVCRGEWGAAVDYLSLLYLICVVAFFGIYMRHRKFNFWDNISTEKGFLIKYIRKTLRHTYIHNNVSIPKVYM